MTAWKPVDGDERPMTRCSYWMALPDGTVALGYHGSASDVAPTYTVDQARRVWRYTWDEKPVDPPPTHWAEIDVPAHPGAQS